MCVSAVAASTIDGTLDTWIPSLPHSTASTWSYPAPLCEMALREVFSLSRASNSLSSSPVCLTLSNVLAMMLTSLNLPSLSSLRNSSLDEAPLSTTSTLGFCSSFCHASWAYLIGPNLRTLTVDMLL
ncbi:hypothetical protein OGATHE_001899 [Ogataea polymorpha]|uniref:Uncharacterized protein n=1 Tax=Ogataea polymorpha TaxID=460523 RepID=A0A9P8PMG6_9ASCO|nr:hypothetical protein OGATHE_001899 [Ogataea polymorpha]